MGWITTHEQTCTDPEDAAPLLQQYATLDMVVAEGEQLLRLGDYLRWVKEAKALLQQCNHGKEDGKEDGKEEGYVKSVFVTHVGWYS